MNAVNASGVLVRSCEMIFCGTFNFKISHDQYLQAACKSKINPQAHQELFSGHLI
jgi:hypothetical protein